MEFHIGEMNSTVQVGDAAGLTPETFDRIVRAVLARVRDELAHEERAGAERRLRPSKSVAGDAAWE
jgi:hypothetical protein